MTLAQMHKVRGTGRIAGAPSLSSKKTPLRWMKRNSLCSATIVHSASCLGRPVSGRAMQYSNAVAAQPRFSCTLEK